MATLYTQKERNIRKTWAFIVLFMCLVIGFGWLMSYLYEAPIILYVAVLVSSAMSIVSYWFSDKIVIAMSGGEPINMKNNPELYRIVENLAITAGLPMPKLYVIPDKAPNAFATGRNPDHAAVAVTEGLLKRLDRSEVEGVLAHELAHIGNRDMLIGTVIVVLVGSIGILSDIFLRMGIHSSDRDDDRDNGVMMVVGLIVSILAPIAATLIQLAISRKREFLADASGALLTRYPEGLANALIKISSDRVPMRNPSTATAHLWLADPFKGNKGRGLSKLFMTHPPIEDRVKALMEMSK